MLTEVLTLVLVLSFEHWRSYKKGTCSMWWRNRGRPLVSIHLKCDVFSYDNKTWVFQNLFTCSEQVMYSLGCTLCICLLIISCCYCDKDLLSKLVRCIDPQHFPWGPYCTDGMWYLKIHILQEEFDWWDNWNNRKSNNQRPSCFKQLWVHGPIQSPDIVETPALSWCCSW